MNSFYPLLLWAVVPPPGTLLFHSGSVSSCVKWTEGRCWMECLFQSLQESSLSLRQNPFLSCLTSEDYDNIMI